MKQRAQHRANVKADLFIIRNDQACIHRIEEATRWTWGVKTRSEADDGFFDVWENDS
jgi:hypothetical protein